MAKLTRNFARAEFDVHEPFPARYADNLPALAALAQWLRDLAGVPGQITSAYRSPARNEAIGGSSTSQHTKGEALDVLFLLVPLRVLASRALADVAAGRAPAFGQLIFYPDKGHVHVSLPRLGARNGEIRLGLNGAYPLLTTARQVPAKPTAPQRRRGLLLLGAIAVVALILALVARRPRR